MTLVRITLPDTGAEALVADDQTGAKIPLHGGETVSVDLNGAFGVLVQIVRHAERYKPPPMVEADTTDGGAYYNEVIRHRNSLNLLKKKR